MLDRTASRTLAFGPHDMLDTFSPTALKRMLWRVRATLTSLSMTTESMVWPFHDQSRLNLEDFISLKDVQLSSLFFLRRRVTWVR